MRFEPGQRRGRGVAEDVVQAAGDGGVTRMDRLSPGVGGGISGTVVAALEDTHRLIRRGRLILGHDILASPFSLLF